MLGEKQNGEVITVDAFIESMRDRTTGKGKPFLELMLSADGKHARCYYWNTSLAESGLKLNDVVSAKGTVKEYNGSNSLHIDDVKIIQNPAPEFLRKLLPSIPEEEIKSYRDILGGLYKKMKEGNYKNLVKAFLKKHLEDLSKTPAASKVHDACLGGLLRHTTNIATLCSHMADMYDHVNRDLLIAAAILHDCGKLQTFTVEGFAIGYTVEGSLLDHIVLGLTFLPGFIKENKIKLEKEEWLLLSHCIAAHHGKLEYGSPVVPSIPEALILHAADMIDSRISIMNEELESLEPGQVAKQKNFWIDTRVYKKKE